MKYLSILVLSLFFVQCSVSKQTANSPDKQKWKVDTLTYFDTARNRKIPVAIYQPEQGRGFHKIPVIISHGFGGNMGGDYLKYSYLTEFLASNGYFVVSIQHELATDELLAMQGNPQVTRKPNWERGAQNILFVLEKIKIDFPDLKYEKLCLIGHSNGGDITVLFAHKYPELVAKIISLDNRRMELPRVSKPKIYTLRSNDYPADDGVLPNLAEKDKFGMTVEFTDINHSSMDNDANIEERKYLTAKVLNFLKP